MPETAGRTGRAPARAPSPSPPPPAPPLAMRLRPRLAWREDPWYGTARNLLLAFLAIVAAAALLAHRLGDARQAAILVAGCSAVALAAGLAFGWAYGQRPAAWAGVALGFLLSRQVLALSGGELFAARDALDHIYGLPLDIVRTGSIPERDSYSYYPALHLLLVATSFSTGLQLWAGAATLAAALGLAAFGVVTQVSEATWKGTALWAGAGYTVAWLAVPPGQLYQPLTLAVLMLATACFLIVRDMRWAPALFVVVLVTLGLSHPYSAAVAGLMLFVAVALYTVLGHGRRFILPVAATLAVGLLYMAFGSQDLGFYLDRILPESGSPGEQASPVDPADPGPVVEARPRYSDTYLLFDSWGFRLAVLSAIAGWVIALFPLRPFIKRSLFLQAFSAAAAGTFLLANLVPNGISPRVLTLASVGLAPLIGFLLARLPAIAGIPWAMVLAVVAVTAPTAAYQYFPWSDEDPMLHAYDDPREGEDLLPLFTSIANGAYRRSNPVSTHQVSHLDQALRVRAFTAFDAPGNAPEGHYFYREGAEEYGFAVTVTQSGTPERRAGYLPFPTEANLALLDSIDRIADIGEFRLHRL